MPRFMFCAFVLLALLIAPSAYAYLDPASGSIILQAVLGGIAGLAVLIKLYWHRLMVLLRFRKVDEETTGEEPSA